MAAAQSPLRRWKRFFRTFDAIDAAVEASVPANHPGDELQCVRELQRARGQVVELLCDASEDDVAEELCLILDDVMVESLVTLRSVPVAPTALASTDVAKAVGALEEHESERIRGLARDIICGWRASVESELAEDKAAMEGLDKLSDEQLQTVNLASAVARARRYHVPVVADGEEKERPVKAAPRPKTGSDRVEPGKSAALVKDLAPLTKKRTPVVSTGRVKMDEMPAAVGNGGGDHAGVDKMEATKRKLRAGYQEAADAKRQRNIIVIEAPKMVEQRQRKMHPIIRERSQARCATSTAVRRSLMPALQRV